MLFTIYPDRNQLSLEVSQWLAPTVLGLFPLFLIPPLHDSKLACVSQFFFFFSSLHILYSIPFLPLILGAAPLRISTYLQVGTIPSDTELKVKRRLESPAPWLLLTQTKDCITTLYIQIHTHTVHSPSLGRNLILFAAVSCNRIDRPNHIVDSWLPDQPLEKNGKSGSVLLLRPCERSKGSLAPLFLVFSLDRPSVTVQSIVLIPPACNPPIAHSGPRTHLSLGWLAFDTSPSKTLIWPPHNRLTLHEN